MRSRPRSLALATALAAVATAVTPHASAVGPHRSWSRLTTGNGYGFATFDGDARRVNFFSNHPYAQPSPSEHTHNLAYDAYFGVRADGASAWLGERPLDDVTYESQSHVVHATQSFGPLRAETYAYAPWGLTAPSLVLALRVTNASRAPVTDAAAYALMNFHLGAGDEQLDAHNEHIIWDAATRSYRETGPSGLTVSYVPFADPSQRAASPNNPYWVGRAGGTLVATDDSGVRDDAVAGYQWNFTALAPGASQWVGVVITLGAPQSARDWIAGRAPDAALTQELDGWEAWRAPVPAGASDSERRVWRQSESVLRMAQSREDGSARGQLLAALPPGVWQITWVRDMSYAIAALSRSGHAMEASAGVDFWRGASVGMFAQPEYVGRPYHVSVVRYYGNGLEWSDTNENGPNVEFDGFGLSTWAARIAGRNDFDNNADTLRGLLDPTGLVAADSSIWEVHWNGQQKHYAYTSIAAARALCTTGATATARALRDAIVRRLALPGGGLAGSYERLQRAQPARDAAVIEAINFGLIDPHGALAAQTIAQLEHLRTPVNRGYFRNEDGGGYDAQEWVYIDLRVADALRRMGRTADADELLAWVTAQADANFGLHAELYHRDSADYVGAIPMVGFGAGAYMLALLDRVQTEPASPECFPPEAAPVQPGSADGGMGPGTPAPGCSAAPGRAAPSGAFTAVCTALALALAARRARPRRA